MDAKTMQNVTEFLLWTDVTLIDVLKIGLHVYVIYVCVRVCVYN